MLTDGNTLRPRAKGRAYSMRVFMSSPRQLLEELGLNPEAQDAPPHGLFAISASARAGIRNFEPEKTVTNESLPDYSWLRDYPLVATVGSSIEIYDLGQTPTTNLAFQSSTGSTR